MNHYETLDLNRDANASEVKRAYFAKVKKHTPDADPEAFKAIREAYETLSDTKRRAAYDTYFVEGIGDEVQKNLLHARTLIKRNDFRAAADFAAALAGQHPKNTDVRRLYAETLMLTKKNGTANKICQALLDENPDDYETLILRGRIAADMGHTMKSGGYFCDAIAVNPQNPKAWIAYMHGAMCSPNQYGLDKGAYQIFLDAMDVSEDMFVEDYQAYLYGLCHVADLCGINAALPYYDRLAVHFTTDENHSEEMYDALMNALPTLIDPDYIETVCFLEKIMPALANSRYRKGDDRTSHLKDIEEGEKFKALHTWIAYGRLKEDKRIHEIFAEMTMSILNDDDMYIKQSMECNIVFDLINMRPSILVLMKDYPDYFKLNHAFYMDCLNDKKMDNLTDKYYKILKRLARKYGSQDPAESDSEDIMMTYVRETPKIGRNDPCPCGSGKKYKQCCL